MSPRSWLKPLAVFAVAFSCAGGARAAQDAAGVEARLAQVMANAPARAAAVQAGARAAFFCANCHGETGISVEDYIPNLAAQDPVYLLAQIDKFGDGRRKDEFMSGLVKVLKPEDRFNMAVFYASQPARPTPARDARQVEAGRQHYQRVCVGCHGAKAQGSRQVARLAGQQQRYLVNALSDFRAAKGTRTDPRMTAVAKRLGNPEITALAAYLASLP